MNSTSPTFLITPPEGGAETDHHQIGNLHRINAGLHNNLDCPVTTGPSEPQCLSPATVKTVSESEKRGYGGWDKIFTKPLQRSKSAGSRADVKTNGMYSGSATRKVVHKSQLSADDASTEDMSTTDYERMKKTRDKKALARFKSSRCSMRASAVELLLPLLLVLFEFKSIHAVPDATEEVTVWYSDCSVIDFVMLCPTECLEKYNISLFSDEPARLLNSTVAACSTGHIVFAFDIKCRQKYFVTVSVTRSRPVGRCAMRRNATFFSASTVHGYQACDSESNSGRRLLLFPTSCENPPGDTRTDQWKYASVAIATAVSVLLVGIFAAYIYHGVTHPHRTPPYFSSRYSNATYSSLRMLKVVNSVFSDSPRQCQQALATPLPVDSKTMNSSQSV